MSEERAGWLRLAALATLQATVILAWGGYHERVRATAPAFRIPLRLVDPFDVVRGRYFALNPADSRLEVGKDIPERAIRDLVAEGRSFAGPALVGFCPDPGDPGLGRVCALRPLSAGVEDEPGRRWARAEVLVSAGTEGGVVHVDLGLDRFFLPDRVRLPARENEPGWTLEVSHRPGQPLLARRLWFRGTPVP